jgi:hypothetical protein
LNPRILPVIALLALGLATGPVALAQTTPAPVATPTPLITAQPSLQPAPPPTAAPTPAATPNPSPTPGGKRHRADAAPKPSPSPDATDTPEPPQFSTMDGVWEVALQPLDGSPAIYSHLTIAQSGQTLSGTWKRDDKSNLPFTGSFDGRLFKLAASEGAKSYTLSGYVENFGDMVGLITLDGSTAFGTPFTAQHRKKQKLGAAIY